MTMHTPVACSLRVAASPLKGATPVARRSRFHGVPGFGHFAPDGALAASPWQRIARWAVVVLGLALAACGNNPPAPDWQMNAKGSSERAANAWLGGNNRVEAAEFARARSELARTGRADLLARIELLRCATRVSALEFEPCTGFDALAADAAPAEQAYARYLAGGATAADVRLLPPAHQAVAQVVNAPDAALASIEEPLSRLVAAGVLFKRGVATPGVIAQAVDTASAQGWRRPLLAWLKVQQQRAQAGGAADEAARIQRRIELVLETGTATVPAPTK